VFTQDYFRLERGKRAELGEDELVENKSREKVTNCGESKGILNREEGGREKL